jgi:hypothetical protein
MLLILVALVAGQGINLSTTAGIPLVESQSQTTEQGEESDRHPVHPDESSPSDSLDVNQRVQGDLLDQVADLQSRIRMHEVWYLELMMQLPISMRRCR